VIKCNREAYLRGKFSMRPRDQYSSTAQLHAGWKGNALDSKSKFMHIHWFPTWAGELFLTLWNIFIIQRAMKNCDHPFAFVTKEGKPYSRDSFQRAHARAVERIGLTPAKSLGTTPHGHRHANAQRMTDADIEPIIRMKALHHKSIESQVVYTQPEIDKVTQLLDRATNALNVGKKLPPPDFFKYGFEDIDPLGLLSGTNPKLRRY
jgi:integrase